MTVGAPQIAVNDSGSSYNDWYIDGVWWSQWNGSQWSSWQFEGYGHWHYKPRFYGEWIDYSTGLGEQGDAFGIYANLAWYVGQWIYDGQLGKWYFYATQTTEGFTGNPLGPVCVATARNPVFG
jgi:hypothetical protein